MLAGMTARRVGAALLISTILFGATGCALMDPYREPLRNADGTIRASTDKDPTDDATALSDARKLAQAMADSYRAATVDHSRAKTGLALGLIGLNTLALFKASTSNVANDGSDLLPAVGFGSAGALNAGGLLISSPRQALYLMGRETVLCARAKTDPFVVPSSDEFYLAATGQTSNTVKNLPQALADATEALDAAGALKASISEGLKRAGAAEKPALMTAGEKLGTAIFAAKAEMERADKVLTIADDAAAARRQAALKLRTDVGMISAAIDRQVQRTEPDMDAIRRALSNSALASMRDLGASAAAETPTKSGSTATATGGSLNAAGLAGNAIDAEVNKLVLRLDASTEALRRARADTTRVVARMSRPANANESACVVAGLVGVSIVKPATALAAPGELQVSIFTLGPAPIVQIDGDGAGLTHEVVSTGAGVGGFQVRIKADAKAKPGPRRLIVRSADGIDYQTAAFEVGAGGVAQVASAAEPAWLTDFPYAKTVLAHGVSGEPKNYDGALTAYAGVHHLTAVWTDDSHKILSEDVKAAMNQAKAIAGDKASPYELWWADDGRITALQKALKVAESGLLDTATRDQLKKDKKTEQLTPDLAQTYGVA
jgi:hypothetical protein